MTETSLEILNPEISGKSNLHEICVLDPAIQEGMEPSLKGWIILSMDRVLAEPISERKDGKLLLVVCILTQKTLLEKKEILREYVEKRGDSDVKLIVLCHGKCSREDFAPFLPENIHLIIPEATDPDMIRDIAANAFATLRLRYERLKLQSRLALSYQEIRRITRVGQLMAVEHNLDALIEIILNEAREMVAADGGSIYVVERKSGEDKPTHLRFKKSALTLNADEFLLPIDKFSMAGYCAVTGEPMRIDDLYELSGEEDYHFNDEFDRSHNYYSKSMMMIPMKNHRLEVIGVIQLINRKRFFEKKLTVEEMKGGEVLPFTQKDMELISAMAGQAAVAIQNSMLLQDIHNLFEGFVKASVTAIEQRDPTTSGHSFRVAKFTVGLAEAVDRLRDGVFQNDRFSIDQIRELRYASLLHDFGKVGVREQVLIKAKKLYPEELELIQWRFHYINKALERDNLKKKLDYIKNRGLGGFEEFELRLDEELDAKLNDVGLMMKTITSANEPTVLEEGNFERLSHIARHKFRLDDGNIIPFLRENELLSLSVRRGTLDQRERMEIESHVSHTYKFLIQIPWTRDLDQVADIARGHHEKLDGSGYPLGLRGTEISLQTRMMTIADIYDALTAPDRPYKKSLPAETALDILNQEADSRRLDKNLLEVFIGAGIFRAVSDLKDVDSFVD